MVSNKTRESIASNGQLLCMFDFDFFKCIQVAYNGLLIVIVKMYCSSYTGGDTYQLSMNNLISLHYTHSNAFHIYIYTFSYS